MRVTLCLLAAILAGCAPTLDGSSLAACEGSFRAARDGRHGAAAESAWERLQYRASYANAIRTPRRGVDHELEALCVEHDGKTFGEIAEGG